MKFRSFISILMVVVLVLLLAGASGFYWLTRSTPLSLLQGGDREAPAAAMFIPQKSPVVVSLLVKPEELESFRLAIAPLGRRRQAKAELAQLRNSLLANTGLDYEKDIQPWLGKEITLAVATTDVDRDGRNGQQPGYLLALETRNPQRSREFLQLFWQKRAIAGMDLAFEQYAGAQIIYGKSPGSAGTDVGARLEQSNAAAVAPDLLPTLATAVVGDRFVLVANYSKVLRDAINNVQAPGLSLSNNQGYQDAIASLSGEQIGLAVVNLPQLADWLREFSLATAAGGQPSEPENQNDRLFESVAIGLNLERQGLLAETALVVAPGQQLEPSRPARPRVNEVARFIPDDSPLVAIGTDLRQLWRDVEMGLTGYDTLKTLLQQPLAKLQAQWDLDLSARLFDRITDDYALALLPEGKALDKTQPLDAIFVTRRSDRLQELITDLNQIAQRKGFSAGTISVEDQDVMAWTRLVMDRKRRRDTSIQADVQASYTVVDDEEVFATSVDAMTRALQSPEGMSLASSRAFRQAIAPLDSNNDGYLFVDWPTARQVIQDNLPIVQLVETSLQPLLDHVQSLTVTSYGRDRTLRRGGIFIQLSSR
jgi:hypothetical protein